MKIQQETITPKFAELLLAKNTANRRLRYSTVLYYAQQMKAGLWMENTGELIKIASDGIIIDGQHRLKAVIKADVPIAFHVAYDVPHDVFKVIDSGIPRNGADAFSIEGIHYSALLAAGISLYATIKSGASKNYIASQKYQRPTSTELLQIYYERPNFWDTAATLTSGWHTAFSRVLAPSYILALYAIFYDINRHDAFTFMNALCTGENLSNLNSTILLLRNKLTTDRISVKKMDIKHRTTLIIKTWNAFRKGIKWKKLVLDRNNETAIKPI